MRMPRRQCAGVAAAAAAVTTLSLSGDAHSAAAIKPPSDAIRAMAQRYEVQQAEMAAQQTLDAQSNAYNEQDLELESELLDSFLPHQLVRVNLPWKLHRWRGSIQSSSSWRARVAGSRGRAGGKATTGTICPTSARGTSYTRQSNPSASRCELVATTVAGSLSSRHANGSTARQRRRGARVCVLVARRTSVWIHAGDTRGRCHQAAIERRSPRLSAGAIAALRALVHGH